MTEPSPPASLQQPTQHHAGVLISVEPAGFTEVRRALDASPGIAVRHLDPETGRCLAVLETDNRAEGERLLTALGRIPHVLSVEVVPQRVDREHHRP